jgi:hypothetical protein
MKKFFKIYLVLEELFWVYIYVEVFSAGRVKKCFALLIVQFVD